MKQKKRRITFLCMCVMTLMLLCKMDMVYASSNPYAETYVVHDNGAAHAGYCTCRSIVEYHPGNCTWVAWQEAYDRLGIALPGWNGNAKTWYNHAMNAGYNAGYTVIPYTKGMVPPDNCIVCWDGDYGHVAWLLSADTVGANIIDGNIFINGTWQKKYEHWCSWSSIESRSGLTIQGFIVFTQPVTGVNLNKTSATLTSKGATVSLSATVSPSNATDKSVTWKSSNTSVAIVSSSGVVTAVANGTATITATTNSGGKTASCNVTVSIPTASSDGWYYTTALPSGVSSTNYEIQYQNVYQQYATGSPGTGWTDTGVDKQEYTKSGSRYESDTPLQTSNTVRLEEYYYYHYCGPSTAWNDVNYYARDGYVHRDEMHLTNFSVYEYSSGKDLENSNITWYHLKWGNADGYDAYCHRYSTGGTCDGSGGEHGERSPYWYKKYVYQNYTVKTLNLYQKTSAWGTSKDASATTVNIRYRLKPTSVTLNRTTATLASKGATVALTATVAPTNAGCKDVTWKSSNTSVATVSSSGVVTAVGNGTATITATTVLGAKTATCNVTVSIATTGVTLNKTSATLTSVGQTIQLTATVAPSNAANKTVTWKSSNTSVATVDATGLVKAVGNGTATITATTVSGAKTATCNVTVSIATTGVTLNKTSATLTSVGQTIQLTATVLPSNAVNKSVTWKSSNTSVATVDSNGLVKAVGNGTATITVTTMSGSKTATCQVVVKELAIPEFAVANVVGGVQIKWDFVDDATGYIVYRREAGGVLQKIAGFTDGVTKSYVDKDVVNGTAYFYAVKAINSTAQSTYTTKGITYKATLATPQFTVANTAGGVQIKWDFVDGATGYIVYRREAGGVLQKIAGFTDGKTKSYVDTNVVDGTAYFYAVKAINSTAQSTYTTKGINYKAALAAPQFTVANVAGGVQIKWDFVEGATGYIVYRREAGGVFQKVAGYTDGVTKSYVDKNVVDGTAYFYAVKAINSSAQSTYTTKGINYKAALATPQFTVANVTGGVQIKWDFVDDATGYIVYRREAGGVFKKIAGYTDGVTKSYVDTNVVDGTAYFYAVKAINSSSQSKYNTKGINYKATLATPQFTASKVAGGVQIDWDFVDGATGYIIYRRDANGTFSKIAGFTDGVTKSYVDTTAVEGTTYYYGVKAINSTKQSTYNSVEITP